jgi:hypothetical protein
MRCPHSEVSGELIRGFYDYLRQNSLSFHVVNLEFNFNGFHNNAFHVSGACGEDERIVKLNVISLFGTQLWPTSPDVPYSCGARSNPTEYVLYLASTLLIQFKAIT